MNILGINALRGDAWRGAGQGGGAGAHGKDRLDRGKHRADKALACYLKARMDVLAVANRVLTRPSA